MRKLLILTLLVFTVLFNSCNSKPDNIIHSQTTDNQGVERVIISPTWGQSFDYATKRGYGAELVIGLILIGGAAFAFIRVKNGSPVVGKEGDVIASFLSIGLPLAAGLAVLFVHPSNIKLNNDKAIIKANYEKAINETGSTQVLWDSLYNNNLIIGSAK